MKKKVVGNWLQKAGIIVFLLGLCSANLFTFLCMGLTVLALELLEKVFRGEFLDDLLTPPEDRI